MTKETANRLVSIVCCQRCNIRLSESNEVDTSKGVILSFLRDVCVGCKIAIKKIYQS